MNLGDGAKDVLEVAKGHASDRQGILAAIIAVIALWFARGTIAEILGIHDVSDHEGEELDADGPLAEDDDEDGNGESAQAPAATEPNTLEPDSSELEPLTTGDTA